VDVKSAGTDRIKLQAKKFVFGMYEVKKEEWDAVAKPTAAPADWGCDEMEVESITESLYLNCPKSWLCFTLSNIL